MAKPIETADQLYSEIKKRGLHLRRKQGRDNALLTELCNDLGCPDRQLASFLKHNKMPAEKFLRSFLQLSAPFAMMFKEIWEFLALADAPDARETIRIRFGINERSPLELDLEAFREFTRTGEKIITLASAELWSYESLHRLFEIPINILKAKNEVRLQPSKQYRPGEPYQMPSVQDSSDEFVKMIQQIRDAFQEIADAYAAEVASIRTVPELKFNEGAGSLNNVAVLLTDLLPLWSVVFARVDDFPAASKREALEYFDREVKPHLRHCSTEVEVDVMEALDVLFLPFWRHRWQTYEIWATVCVLQGLTQFRPQLVIDGTYCSLDGFSAGIVALLDTIDDDACVVLQMQTPFRSSGRKAIKPDLSICRDQTLSAESRAVVVEFKQRVRLDCAHVEEVGSSYFMGSPEVGGVVIVNYDKVAITPTLPDRVSYLEDIRPDRVSGIEAMRDLIDDAMDHAGLEPRRSRVVALLDVSSSMGRLYESPSAQTGLWSLLGLGGVNVFRFNNGLAEGGDLDDRRDVGSIQTSGGTDLDLALQQIEQALGIPHVLLLISDHGYRRTAKLDSIESFKECEPEQLSEGVLWLREQL